MTKGNQQMKKKSGKDTGAWKNRIVSHGEQPANQFLAHELNARRHPSKQRNALRGSLNDVGWIAPVIVSAKTGKILDGHARVEESLSQDENSLVPFIEVDVSENEERTILATFDPITGLAIYERESLDALLQEVNTSEMALQELLADLAQKEGIIIPDDVNVPDVSSQIQGLEYRVIVICDSESHQSQLLEQFESEGLQCQALIS
jgi:hypothetical protein